VNKLCGAIPSPVDERDYTVCAALSTFPQSFRMAKLPKIKQQTVGSCVAHSSAYLFEYLFGAQFGVGFTYGYRPEGYSQNSGMIPRNAADTAVDAGNVLLAAYHKELDMPAMKHDVDKNLTKLLRYASKRRIASYARCYTAADIKTQLIVGNPVMFCAAISQTNTEINGVFPCTSPVEGYHEMSIWGWEQVGGREYFYVANSWSAHWGIKGFCYVSPEDVLRVGDVIAFSMTEDDATIRRTLKLGMRGEDVRRLELRLNEESGIVLNADGIFTESTRSAVMIVQKRLGIDATGTVGTKTWRALGLQP
jgi:hypothetical protein